MTLKNTIKFDDWKQAWNCAKVMHRLPRKWNADIQKNLDLLRDKIEEKMHNEDGTVNLRLKKTFTEEYGQHLATHIPSVEDMYKTEYSEAFKKLFN